MNALTFSRLGSDIKIVAGTNGMLSGIEIDQHETRTELTNEDCLVILLEHFGDLSDKTMLAVVRETHPMAKIS
jgi:hypothetical protein